jgi:hypothetical protein
MTKPATQVLALAGSEAMRLDYDRLGTEHLLLGLASEGGASKTGLLTYPWVGLCASG